MLVSAVRLTAFSVVIDTKLSGVQGCLLLSLLLSQQQKRPGCWRNGLTSSSLPTPLFLVTFSPMMLHSKRSVNQWRSLSFKGKRKYKHAPYTTVNTSATWICSFIPNASHFQGPEIWNRHVYSSVNDILSCSVSCRFLLRCHLRRGAHSGPLPRDTMRIPSPKIEVSSPPSSSSALPGICTSTRIIGWRARSQILHPQTWNDPAPCWGALLMFFFFVKYCRQIA